MVKTAWRTGTKAQLQHTQYGINHDDTQQSSKRLSIDFRGSSLFPFLVNNESEKRRHDPGRVRSSRSETGPGNPDHIKSHKRWLSPKRLPQWDKESYWSPNGNAQRSYDKKQIYQSASSWSRTVLCGFNGCPANTTPKVPKMAVRHHHQRCHQIGNSVFYNHSGVKSIIPTDTKIQRQTNPPVCTRWEI